jgi:hypothetical protein
MQKELTLQFLAGFPGQPEQPADYDVPASIELIKK